MPHGHRKRSVRDPSQIEYLARLRDTVLVEKLPSGNLRVLSLGRGRARTFDPCWLAWIDSCLKLLETFLNRWDERRDIHRRKQRYEQLRQAIERRQHVPAFTCRLCSKHLG